MKNLCIGDNLQIHCYKHNGKVHRIWDEAVILDVKKDYIPVVPAQHYFMGGIKVDMHSKTSMENLFAIGETACNGVHGKNRLASNSLLESLVFAKRAALKMAEKEGEIVEKEISLSTYKDRKKYEKENYEIAKKLVKGDMTNV